MAQLLSSTDLRSLSDGPLPIAFFGAGSIADKTAEKYSINPQFVVDNNKDAQGTMFLGKSVQSPQELFGSNVLISVVICSTSIDEIEGQLASLGVADCNIYISPKLREFSIISDFESYQFDLLFTSGLQNISPEGVVSGGGLYRVKGSFDDYSISKIAPGSCHGICSVGEFKYVVNERYGVAKYNSRLELVESYALPSKLRPHGIDYCPALGLWALACSLGDCVLLLDDNFSEVDRIYFSDNRNAFSGKPQHHANDLCFIQDQLLVSMFSISGHWKRGVFDGGVQVYDTRSKFQGKSLYGDLKMPHSISSFDNNIWILDSLRRTLYRGNEIFLSNFLSFSRGLGFSLDYSHLFVGQSKNRNFSDLLADQFIATSLDTAITVVRLDARLSRNIILPASISEIHAIAPLA